MVDTNNVIININYKGAAKTKNAGSEQKLVTEWHKPRIVTAVILLIIFIWLIYYFFTNNMAAGDLEQNINIVDSKNDVSPNSSLLPESDVTVDIKKNIQFEDKAKSVVKIESVKIQPVKEVVMENIMTETKIKPVISIDSRVARAMLTSKLINKEPVDNITTPVKVNNNMATGIYYFTEILDMNGQTLFHVWLMNDKLIFKRQIDIVSDRWRASTSKLITYYQTGLWKARLVNKRGEILNEIKFQVIEE